MPGAIGKFRSGKGGRITVGSTNCRLKEWSVDDKGTDLDTTNFESFSIAYGSSGQGGGRSFSQGLIGVEEASWNYNGDWDASQNPLDTVPGIYVRDDGPQMKQYTNRIDNVFYLFYATRILDANVACSIIGLVTFKASGKNQGPYLRPTGSVA